MCNIIWICEKIYYYLNNQISPNFFLQSSYQQQGGRALRPKPEDGINTNQKAKYLLPNGQTIRPNLPNISNLSTSVSTILNNTHLKSITN